MVSSVRLSRASWLGRVLLVILYAGLLLVLVEGALRGIYVWRFWQGNAFQQSNVFVATAMRESDDSLWLVPWQSYRPNSHLDHQLPSGERYTVSINSHGFRTKEFAKKREGVIRIVAIGGSTTFQGVSNEATYPALLEGYLSAMFPEQSIEVLNLGISGTRAGYWAFKLDELIAYEPDIVIQYNAINDLSRPLYYERHYGEQGIPWRYKSYLYQYLFPIDMTQYADVYAVPVDHFQSIRDRLAQSGIEYVASTFATPRPETAMPAFSSYLDLNTSFPWGLPLGLHDYNDLHRLVSTYNQYFLKAFEGGSMHYVRMDMAVDDARYFMDVCHMTPEGIALQAQAFLPVVADMIRSRLSHEPS